MKFDLKFSISMVDFSANLKFIFRIPKKMHIRVPISLKDVDGIFLKLFQINRFILGSSPVVLPSLVNFV